jgi:hypothetical protein
MCGVRITKCMPRLMLTAVLAAGAASSAAAEDAAMSTDDLQQLCSGTDHVSANACRIYILGVTQGVHVGLDLARNASHARPCVPAGMSAEALEKLIKKQLAERLAAVPADRDLDASRFIATVLARSFPCPRSPG